MNLNDRIVRAPPSGPVRVPQKVGRAEPIKQAVSTYVYPTKAPPQYKTNFHKTQVNNASIKRSKLRTQYAREYTLPVNTSHYREREKIRPMPQYNIRF